jgi:hypothetical protein
MKPLNEASSGGMMTASEIQGHEYALDKVFCNDFVFSIPLYQRPYAWTTDEAGDLFDDVYAAMGAPDQNIDEVAPYFLGSVVLIKPSEAKPAADVVDGQQRLTTLAILLAALRETADDPKFRSGLTKRLYEDADALAGTAARYRLSLRDRDAQFFRSYIQDEGGLAKLNSLDPAQLDNDAQVNVRANALLLLRRLQALSAQERQHFARFLLVRCFVIVVSTRDQKSAYRIFSVLNDRGLDLSYTDILKAEIIGKLSATMQEEYTEKWEQIEEELGREGFNELWAHIRTIAVKDKTRTTILEEVRQHVKPGANPAGFIDDQLVPLGAAFDVVRAENYESAVKAEAVNGVLADLNRIDNRDWMPPALVYVVQFGKEPEKLLSFLQNLERQAAIMLILRFNVNDRIERYKMILQELEAGRTPFAPESPVLENDASERQDAKRALNGDVYLVTKTRALILTRLDRLISATAAKYDVEKVTVEHVLPQQPATGSMWEQWFPDVKLRDEWVHKVANLVLLTQRKNSEAQNYDFQVKKKKYFTGKNGVALFALTSEVLNVDAWTPDVLAERQQRLVQTLCHEWRI